MAALFEIAAMDMTIFNEMKPIDNIYIESSTTNKVKYDDLSREANRLLAHKRKHFDETLSSINNSLLSNYT